MFSGLLILISLLYISESHPNYHIKWKSMTHGSYLSSPPLFLDDAAFLATADGELVGLSKVTGQPPLGTMWPVYHHNKHFFSSPLAYDVDMDGEEELIFSSHDGTVYFYSTGGKLKRTKRIPQMFISKKWKEKGTTLHNQEITKVMKSVKDDEHAVMDIQLFSTPILSDLDRDGTISDVIFATNYVYRDAVSNSNDAIALVLNVFCITSMKFIKQIFLELNQLQSSYPCYALSSPYIFDLSKNHKGMEIVTTSASGKIHLISSVTFESLPGYPIEYNSSGLSPVIGIKKGLAIEHIVIVSSIYGNIIALSPRGDVVWERKLKVQTSPMISTFFKKESLLFTTSNGFMYALDTRDGKDLIGFPKKISESAMTAKPLLYRCNKAVYLVGVASDGKVHTVDLVDVTHPVSTFHAGEASHVGFSLSPHDGIYLPAADGLLIKYSVGLERNTTTSSSIVQCGGLAHGVATSLILLLPRKVKITGTEMHIPFEIIDAHGLKQSVYKVQA